MFVVWSITEMAAPNFDFRFTPIKSRRRSESDRMSAQANSRHGLLFDQVVGEPDQRMREVTNESAELIEQRLCPLQIKRFKALAKPIVHAREQSTGFGALASIAPKPRQARYRAQFPGFCLSFSRNCERSLEMRFRFADVLFRPKQRDFPRDATHIGFAPPFSCLFNRRQSFGHVLPCLVEPAEFRH
jgi:hypothetical protein